MTAGDREGAGDYNKLLQHQRDNEELWEDLKTTEARAEAAEKQLADTQDQRNAALTAAAARKGEWEFWRDAAVKEESKCSTLKKQLAEAQRRLDETRKGVEKFQRSLKGRGPRTKGAQLACDIALAALRGERLQW